MGHPGFYKKEEVSLKTKIPPEWRDFCFVNIDVHLVLFLGITLFLK